MRTGVDVFTSTLSWILASAEEPIAGNLALLLHNYGNIFAVIFFHTSDAAGLKSGQSNQKRNIRVHRGDRRERREKKLNNLCVLSELCGEILLGTTSDFM